MSALASFLWINQQFRFHAWPWNRTLTVKFWVWTGYTIEKKSKQYKGKNQTQPENYIVKNRRVSCLRKRLRMLLESWTARGPRWQNLTSSFDPINESSHFHAFHLIAPLNIWNINKFSQFLNDTKPSRGKWSRYPVYLKPIYRSQFRIIKFWHNDKWIKIEIYEFIIWNLQSHWPFYFG